MEQTHINQLEVGVTRNYDQFSFLDHNRSINELHLQRLEKSMRNRLLICPLICNEKMQIIDGQHRFKALQKLGLPVHYIIVYGYGEDEIQIYNALQTNWSLNDFLMHHLKKQNPVYEEIKNCMDKYNVSLSVAISFMTTGSLSGSHSATYFKNGTFKITRPNYEELFKAYNEIKHSVPDICGQRSFTSAFAEIVLNPQCNRERLKMCIAKYSHRIQRCATKIGYLKELQKIYNYALPAKNKVRFFDELRS